VGSLALHGGIVAATLFFTVSHTLDIADQSPPVIPVDVVTIAPKTNIRATAHRLPKIAPTPVPPVQKAVPAPPVPQPKTEPQPAPEKIPVPKAEPLEKPEPAPVVPKLRPKPAPKEEEKKNFDVDKVLALLNKVAPSQSAAPNAPEAQRTVRGFGAQNAMTADLQDALRSQIEPCWSPPVGAPHPERLVVTFDLFLNPDGSVARPPQLLATSGDPYFHAAEEAALRAIYTCAPYKLPADRYEQWREINPFIFDPRQMTGQ
jgi:outer membrane biosynthesis protein TonB